MVGEALRERSEFGIVLARDEGIVNAGCTVAVETVITEYPDGRMDILTLGKRRFEILYINQEKSYLQAEVDFFEDEGNEIVPEELRAKAVHNYRELTGSEDAKGRPHPDPVMTDWQLSFQLAQAVPDLDFQSRLLRSRSEVERLQQLTRFLEEHIPRARMTARMRRLAPLNGFGHKIAGV